MEAILILQALKQLKVQKKGQNLKNMVAYCRKDCEWDRPKVLDVIEAAKTWGTLCIVYYLTQELLCFTENIPIPSIDPRLLL